MYQFFVDPHNINGNKIIIDGADVNHIKNVLRMRPGEEIAVSNGIDGKEYRCGIVNISDVVECELRFVKEDGVELLSKITLFQGFPKGDKMEFIVQKAVELGVYEIVPVFMKRSIVKLDEKKAASRVNRYQGIAEAAAKQSKRAIVPKIHSCVTMKEAIQLAKEMDIVLVPYELAENMSSTRKILSGIEADKSIGFFIGPEGGIDGEEIVALRDIGAKEITLGKRILRTETAAMTLLSWFVYLLEE